MAKRTTVIIDDDVYDILVRESISRYGTTRALSKVLNELVREATRLRAITELRKIIQAEKKASISVDEFHKFRRELSREFEER